MNSKLRFAYHDHGSCDKRICPRCAIALCIRMARRAGRHIERRGAHHYAIFCGGLNIRIIEGLAS